MVFSSTLFTFGFLPIVVLLYYLSKDQYRNYILLAASLLFYSYGEPGFIIIMLLSIFANYFFARGIGSARSKSLRRVLLAAALIENLGILYIFKYLDFSIAVFNRAFRTEIALFGITLPIGISFFTFQTISYIVDVYRKRVEPQKNIFYVMLYISFFPQLIAGPIVRYSTIADQIEQRTTSLEKFGEGARRFMLGFCKKVILANNLALVAEIPFSAGADVTACSAALLWLGSVSYTLQIFYDFSGYSDMAIGLGKMFGFEFEENFNYPYISKSVTEFWRRWHISLGQWFRDYVYIPLGGSRTGVIRHILNLLLVWALTGLWHGANDTFIAWGLGYFILLVIEKYIIKPETRKWKPLRILWQIVTLACVNFGWVMFNASGIKFGIKYCLGMLGFFGNGFTITAQVTHLCREYGFYIIAGILFATPVTKWLRRKAEKAVWIKKAEVIVFPLGYLLLFLWAVSFLILGAHNPFIYFNF